MIYLHTIEPLIKRVHSPRTGLIHVFFILWLIGDAGPAFPDDGGNRDDDHETAHDGRDL